ncbi:MAG: DeoR/GlpR transcriptional regulator [Dermatophilaceae bacterium]|nr:DeoR/GlpR transcriptional regulator [Dermatophilaceae bacterium]
MLAVQRRLVIIDLLRRRGATSVEDLASRLRVSLSTVRRDLHELEREGLVRRVYGGAVLTEGSTYPCAPERPRADREVERREDKQAIAEAAVGLVARGATLLLTGGTTTAALVPLVAAVPDVTVVTNSLDVARRLSVVDVDVIVLGGVLRRPELSLLGHLVGVSINEVHVDHAIMGVYGIDPRSGALGASAQKCETDRTLARCAQRLTILAAADKFARRSPHVITAVEGITEIITSSDAPLDDVEALRSRGVNVSVVNPTSEPFRPARRETS